MSIVLECANCGEYIYGLMVAEISDDRWELITEHQATPRPCEQMLMDDKNVCEKCLAKEEADADKQEGSQHVPCK